jgi:RNA polymerase sigma factor (sigma-70 family)
MGLLSDERLARRAARGDRRAFEAIYRRYDQALYRFCLAMVGNPQDAQDALQNTMVKALRALPGEQRPIQLKPWLYRIARNESVEVLRRRRESDELAPELEASAGVVETAEARERLRQLLGDLEQLPDRQRSVLVMRELSGLDFAEIGAALDTSAAVARQALYEARLSLRQLEAGREMCCADVMRELSDADGRVIRRREIRSHLRGCADCRAFQEAIGDRRGELAAIAPLPLAASAGLLQGMLGAKAGAGAAGAGAGAAVATSTIVKSAATVAVATVVGVSAADRGGLVDVPLPGGNHGNGGASGGAPDALGAPQQAGGAGPRGTARSVGDAKPAHGGSIPTLEQGEQPRGSGAVDSETPERGAAPRDIPAGSSAGASPPGGGYGSTASQRRGKPDALPAAARHGQETAAAHRPPRATAHPPQKGANGSGEGRASGGKPSPSATRPRVKPMPPPKPPPPPHPLAPPATEKAPPSVGPDNGPPRSFDG